MSSTHREVIKSKTAIIGRIFRDLDLGSSTIGNLLGRAPETTMARKNNGKIESSTSKTHKHTQESCRVKGRKSNIAAAIKPEHTQRARADVYSRRI